MKAYDIFRPALCVMMVITGFIGIFACLFSFHRDFVGNLIFLWPYWNPHIDVYFLFLTLLLPSGIWLLKKKPVASDLIPAAGIVFGICTVAMGLYHMQAWALFFQFIGDVILGIGMIVSALSFKRGFLHTTMRMVLIISLLLMMIGLKIAITFALFAGNADIWSIIQINADYLLYILVGIPLAIVCIYPEDVPGVRLNRQLRDIEYTMFNKAEMYITKEGIDGISGRDLSGWTESDNPSIDMEFRTELYGSKTQYIVRQQRWKGDDGIYFTIITDRGTSVSSGAGMKVLYVANDNTVSSLKGQPVRIYTADHTFIRIIVLDLPVEEGNKYKLQLDKFFQDF